MKIEGDSKLISAAFIKARGEMAATVTKDGTGNYGKYPTLAAIVEATTGAFSKNNLAIVQEASIDEQGVCVETWLVHESGATMQFSPLTMPLTDRRPQAVGSAITYARRYALGAICGLAPDDDDGQAAQDATPQQNARKDAQPRRMVDTATKEANAPRRASALPTEGDAISGKKPSPPTDEELNVITSWRSRKDAEAWAVEAKACLNDFEAARSMDNVIEKVGGKVTKENVNEVYLRFYRRQVEKLTAKQAA